jgi:hypothetical protein
MIQGVTQPTHNLTRVPVLPKAGRGIFLGHRTSIRTARARGGGSICTIGHQSQFPDATLKVSENESKT